MDTKKNISKKQWICALPFLFIIIILVLGGLLLSARGEAIPSMNKVVIDDFSRELKDAKGNPRWTLAAGQKNDNTISNVEFTQDAGKSFLHIKRLAPPNNNWYLAYAGADLADKTNILNTAAYDGIYLLAKGGPGTWTLGLWMQDPKGQIRLYKSLFETKDKWQEIQIPIRSFQGLSPIRPPDSQELLQIENVVNSKQRTAEIFLDEIGFYREQRMYNKLTPAEERVIVNKGTERPFTGKYTNYFEKGVYTCKRCGAELFESDAKFKSDCGWPSFDEQIPGAVKWQTDADGIRTEIICARCGAHLGHVFQGERLTPKNTRYCVNSISMNFTPAEERKTEQAIFASGCFWGTEFYFQATPGVISTTVGFTGGHVDNPTYQQVCTDKTGHAESVEVVYDPSKISYEQLAKLFFETHDFTQFNRQGPDVGTQYRSAIFYLNDQQKQIATQLVEELKKKGYNVKTQIAPAGKFWPAEDYHQHYYAKNGKTPYCHIYRKIF
jgi:peptide methionine sulfoxide reductase msrA/msrB